MPCKIHYSHYISPLLPFWTSSCLLPASTSNPPRFDFLFGLHHALSPLQRPICHASASLLDFISPSPRFNVQSATLQLPFWTSSGLLPASTSNPPLFGFLFGLHHAFSPLQRPIRHASASLLDVLVPSLHAKVHSPPMSLRHREGRHRERQQRKQRAGG